MFKKFFMEKVSWGYPWEEKTTKFQQWYTLAVFFVGIYALSYWITTAIFSLAETIFEKTEKDVMEEEETE